MIRNVERLLKAMKLGSSETGDQENIVDENTGEVHLINFIRERQIQMDVIETTIEVSAEELLGSEPTLGEIENEIKELSNCLQPLIRDDAEYRNEV